MLLRSYFINRTPVYQEPGSGEIMPVPLYFRKSCEDGRAVIGCYSDSRFSDTQITYRLFEDANYSKQIAYSGVRPISEVYYFKNLESGKTYYVEAYGNVSTYSRKDVTALNCVPDPFAIYWKSQTNESVYGLKDGSVTVEPKGGLSPYTYQIKTLNDPETAYSTPQTEPTFNNLGAGIYVIKGADAAGKTAIVSPDIDGPKTFIVEIVYTQPDVWIKNTYSFDTETETIVPTSEPVLESGPYYLHPTPEDIYGYCVPLTTKRRYWSYDPATKAATQHEVNAVSCGFKPVSCSLAVTQQSVTHVTSLTQNNGSFSVVAESLQGGVEYSLNGVSWNDSLSVTEVSAGLYNVYIRDANLCELTVTIEVKTEIPCTLSVQPADVIGDTVFIWAKSEFPITYSWDGGLTWTADNQKPCLAAGPGLVLVKDASGCEKEISYNVTDPDLTTGVYFVYFLVIDKIYYRIDEPLKFDNLELQLKRDKKLHGVNYVYSELALGFDCSAGYELIKQQYKLHGCDAEIGYIVMVRPCFSCGFELEYSGRLNMTDYKNKIDRIEANIEQSGLSSLFTNSLKKKVDLLDPLGATAKETDLINPNKLQLHSRAIVKNYEAYANAPYFTSELIENDQNKTSPYIVLGFGEIVTDDLGKVNDTQPGFSYIRSRYAIFEPEEIGEFDLDFYVNLDLVVNRIRGDFDEAKLFLYYQLNDTPAEILNKNINSNVSGAYRVRGLEGRVKRRLQLQPGDKVYLYGELQVNDKSGNYQFTFELGLNSSSYIRINAVTQLQETTVKAFPVYEALAKVLSGATGESNVLRSRFFGRVDSTPQSYKEDGPAALYALLSGNMLRGLNLKGLSLSFQDLIDGLNPIFNFGVGFTSENGKEVIEIEAAEYFYADNEIIAFPNVANYTEEIAPEFIYDTVTIGFDKWQPDGRVENGLDEPNARREWVTPIRNHKNEYKAESKFIAGGYLLEAQRRAGITNNDSKNDNDTFIVSSVRGSAGFQFVRGYDAPNKAAVEFSPEIQENVRVGQNIKINGPDNAGVYKVIGITQRYEFYSVVFPTVISISVLELDRAVKNPAAVYLDTIVLPGSFSSEKDEPFSQISGLLSPETAYNLRITPARIFRNHALFLNSGCSFKQPLELYRTPYGEGNAELVTRFKDSETRLLGDNNRDNVREKADVAIQDARNAERLYEPLYINFETELGRAEFQQIKNQRRGYIRAWNGEEWVLGYIMEIKYKISKRICKFKLLKAAKTYIPGQTQTREFNEREFNNREFN